MKIGVKTGLILMTAIISFVACNPPKYDELSAPRNITESLAGTWKLTRATQVDEDASTKGFPYKEMDITNLFPYTDFILTLNVNAGAPSTFSTTPGSSPLLINLSSGSWSVDDADYPKDITLVNGAVTEKVTLGGYPVGSSNTLKLKVERKDATTGKLLLSYSYEFAKQ